MATRPASQTTPLQVHGEEEEFQSRFDFPTARENDRRADLSAFRSGFVGEKKERIKRRMKRSGAMEGRSSGGHRPSKMEDISVGLTVTCALRLLWDPRAFPGLLARKFF